MRKASVTLDTVRKLALALPGVEEGTAWGSPAFKVSGKLMACIATNRSSEPGSLVVTQVEFEERDAMIEDDPATFYFTDHYKNYPCVLVRLGRVRHDTLRALLETTWRRCARKRLLAERDHGR